MSLRRFLIPKAQKAVIDRRTGAFEREWFQFLADISGRVADNVAPLAASPTNAEIATAFNALLDALIASNQMEPD